MLFSWILLLAISFSPLPKQAFADAPMVRLMVMPISPPGHELELSFHKSIMDFLFSTDGSIRFVNDLDALPAFYILDVPKLDRIKVSRELRRTFSPHHVLIEELNDILEPVSFRSPVAMDVHSIKGRLAEVAANNNRGLFSVRLMTLLHLLRDLNSGALKQVNYQAAAIPIDAMVTEQLDVLNSIFRGLSLDYERLNAQVSPSASNSSTELAEQKKQIDAASALIGSLLQAYDGINTQRVKHRVLNSLGMGNSAGIQYLQSNPERREEYISHWIGLLQHDLDATEKFLNLKPQVRTVRLERGSWVQVAREIGFNTINGMFFNLGYYSAQGDEPFTDDADGVRIPNTILMFLGSRDSAQRQSLKDMLVSFILDNEIRVDEIAELHTGAMANRLAEEVEMTEVGLAEYERKVDWDAAKIVTHPSIFGPLNYLANAGKTVLPASLSTVEFQISAIEVFLKLLDRVRSEKLYRVVVDAASTFVDEIQEKYNGSTPVPQNLALKILALSNRLRRIQRAALNAASEVASKVMARDDTSGCARWFFPGNDN